MDTTTTATVEAIAPTTTTATAGAPAGAQNTETTAGETDEKAVPYARFKEINEAHKATQKQLDALVKAEDARKRATLTETERAKAEVIEWQKKHDDLNTKVRELTIQQAFGRVAEAQKLRFVNAQAQADAFALLDLTGVDLADDGNVTGLEGAIKALAKRRPYLFAIEKAQDIDAGKATGSGGDSPQQVQSRIDDIKRRWHLA